MGLYAHKILFSSEYEPELQAVKHSAKIWSYKSFSTLEMQIMRRRCKTMRSLTLIFDNDSSSIKYYQLDEDSFGD